MNQLTHLKHVQDTTTPLVVPAARQGGTAGRPSSEGHLARGLDTPSGKVRLARGLNAPSGGVRLTRGLNPDPRVKSASLEGWAPPRAGSTSLEGTRTRVPHAPAPVYGHLMPWHRRTRTTTLARPGIASRCCSTNSMGEAIPTAVRQGRCQLRDTVPPTPVWLTRRALEGGRQHSRMSSLCLRRTTPWRQAGGIGHPHHCQPCATIPATAAPRQTLWRHPDAVGARRDKTSPQRPLCHVRAPVNRTLESAHYGGQSTNRYTAALEAAPVRAQDALRRLNRSGIRQDDRQLHSTALHNSTRRETVQHACKLLPPWPIKGGAAPQPRERGARRTAITYTLSAFSTILALASIKTSGTWGAGLLSRLACSHPSTSTTVQAIQCPEHTAAGRTAPVGTRINQVYLVA
jgi:hypothetical protein